MTKKCVYCGKEISDDRMMEICDECGISVWGKKMFNAILSETSNAMKKGDLCHHQKNIG